MFRLNEVNAYLFRAGSGHKAELRDDLIVFGIVFHDGIQTIYARESNADVRSNNDASSRMIQQSSVNS